VTVPYAVALAKLIAARSGGSVRLRRDFAQVLAAIKSHALMHRYHRDTDERGQIIADIDRDYRTVAELMADPISEASGASVKKEVQETINAVRVETVDLAHDDGATAYQIGKRLNLDKRKTTKVAGLHGLRGFDQEIDRDDQENSRCGACDGFGCPSCKPENFGLPPKRKSQRASTR
jgi:urease gamma subunit